MANTLEDAKLARDTVKASDRVVQMGSQWLSDPYQLKVRELIRGGTVGKVVSISPRAPSIRASISSSGIFNDFSDGITDQWYNHGAGRAHFYLDTFIPDETVAQGGIFAWHDVRENPDTFQCISSFTEKEVLYTYGTTFGNGYGDHTIIRGTRGTLYSPGGEGSPQ